VSKLNLFDFLERRVASMRVQIIASRPNVVALTCVDACRVDVRRVGASLNEPGELLQRLYHKYLLLLLLLLLLVYRRTLHGARQATVVDCQQHYHTRPDDCFRRRHGRYTIIRPDGSGKRRTSSGNDSFPHPGRKSETDGMFTLSVAGKS